MHADKIHFDPQHKAYLLSAERQARWDPPRFLAKLNLKPGQSVVDLGSGPGFWTWPLADAVGPGGTVWAMDDSAELLADLMARRPPAQVQVKQCKLPHIGLPDGTVDLAWAAFVYHEVTPPETFAAELCRVLKPGGRVAILEWRPDSVSESGPPRHIRPSPQQLVAWLAGAGLTGGRLTWQDEDAYLVEAVRPE